MNSKLRLVATVLVYLFSPGLPFSLIGADNVFKIGVAKADITPGYPIRLTGYAVRKTESEGVEQHLWAKALAIGSDPEDAAVLMTVDNCGVSKQIIEEVAERLAKKSGLKRERFVVCSSHTHAGPCVAGFAPNIFAMPIPDEQLATIARYSRELIDQLERAALEALANRKAGRLAWSEGRSSFAGNRRTPGGPVDHSLPMLSVTEPDGKLRAVVANYACHCTTLGGEFNKVCGDWAGYAQEYIERDNPGAIALITIGCGADANPQPRGTLDLAKKHGQEIATEIKRLLELDSKPLSSKLSCQVKRLELPFDKLPTRDQWEERAKQEGIVGYHARMNLAKLDRGEALPIALPYLVQTWNFGNQLALVFLSGEVVVDYALRLKKEFDGDRLWVTAYANDVPCYIPSKRILREGGYEAETSLWYYDRPARLAPELEDSIVGAVHELMPREFLSDLRKAEFPPPKSPEESRGAIRTKPGLTVELAAAEPLIASPVAIDWSADGRLWVVEMRDFPLGMDGNWKPGGRVKFLEDLDGDGKYDKATLFLDEVPFPTGITAWGKGVLVCAAPDILYAEDTDGDGKADVVKKLFTGFATENYQARVNSLSLGLDNWIYGANGLIGGKIKVVGRLASAAIPENSTELNIRGRDFRLHPDTGEFEPAAGLTQQGRVRDDWGNWFGCDNSTLVWNYPMPDHYVGRNPYVAPPDPRVSVARDPDPNRLFPISRTLQRFNDPGSANRTTSACGIGIYRDDLLGEEFYGNAFVCEPVHNLVHRLQLESQGVTFTGRRPADEQQSEFLASKDNWFRPVQIRTGPDGALWVVDMYRFVVEHPRWITPDRLAELDLRAGDDKGRIYRVFPRGKKLKPIRNLNELPTPQLVEALDTSNGTERDRVHLALMQRNGNSAIGPLVNLAKQTKRHATRLQTICLLAGLKALPPGLLEQAFVDPSAAIRRHAVRLSEELLFGRASVTANPESARDSSQERAKSRLPGVSPSQATRLRAALLQLVNDPDPGVRFQLALTLGDWEDPGAGSALGQLASAGVGDSWMRAAVVSSAGRFPDAILKALLGSGTDSPARSEMIGKLIGTVIGGGDPKLIERVFIAIIPLEGGPAELWRLNAIASFLEALARKNIALPTLARGESPEIRAVTNRLAQTFRTARALAADAQPDPAKQIAAIRLLGWEQNDADLDLLVRLIDMPNPLPIQRAALEALGRSHSSKGAQLLLSGWLHHSPVLRTATVETLLSWETWTKDLLGALEKGIVAPGEVSAADRQRLLKHPNAEIQRRAKVIFAFQKSESRTAAVEKYQDAAKLAGDQTRGAVLFGKACASCHAFRGQGIAVGPNLAALTDKSPRFLLTAILDPNAAVETRYLGYTIETKDGQSLSGIITAETATGLVLVNSTGARQSLLRADIAEIHASNLSLMPEGLEQGMTLQELADLIAYLQYGPTPFGSPAPEQAAKAQKEFMSGGVNGLARILIAAEQSPYPSWLGTQPLHLCRQTDGKSKLTWQTFPTAAELKPDSVCKFRLAAAMGFVSQPAGAFQLSVNGKPAIQFDVARFDQSWQSDDGNARMSYLAMQNNEEDSNGVLEVEVRSAMIEPGRPVTFEVTGSAAQSQRWFGVYEVK